MTKQAFQQMTCDRVRGNWCRTFQKDVQPFSRHVAMSAAVKDTGVMRPHTDNAAGHTAHMFLFGWSFSCAQGFMKDFSLKVCVYEANIPSLAR